MGSWWGREPRQRQVDEELRLADGGGWTGSLWAVRCPAGSSGRATTPLWASTDPPDNGIKPHRVVVRVLMRCQVGKGFQTEGHGDAEGRPRAEGQEARLC